MNCTRLLFAACVIVLCGCTSAPIHTVNDSPVVVSGAKPVSLDDVRVAISRAGTRLGWQMVAVENGVINARLNLRAHAAAVDVRYSVKSYSIVYRDSTNLDYRGGQIHKNYNGWIQNLDREIRNELLLL
jgi:hypothetical protein